MAQQQPPWNSIEPLHPAIVDARQIPLLEQAVQAQRHDPALIQLRKAVLLAPTLTICQALLRGEHVPISRLDAHWAAKFGIRQAA